MAKKLFGKKKKAAEAPATDPAKPNPKVSILSQGEMEDVDIALGRKKKRSGSAPALGGLAGGLTSYGTLNGGTILSGRLGA